MLDSNAEKWVKKAFREMLVYIYYSIAGEDAKNILVRYDGTVRNCWMAPEK